MIKKTAITIFALAATCAMAYAQKYKYVDKTVAVVGNEAIMISDIEAGGQGPQRPGLFIRQECPLRGAGIDSRIEDIPDAGQDRLSHGQSGHG